MGSEIGVRSHTYELRDVGCEKDIRLQISFAGWFGFLSLGERGDFEAADFLRFSHRQFWNIAEGADLEMRSTTIAKGPVGECRQLLVPLIRCAHTGAENLCQPLVGYDLIYRMWGLSQHDLPSFHKDTEP